MATYLIIAVVVLMAGLVAAFLAIRIHTLREEWQRAAEEQQVALEAFAAIKEALLTEFRSAASSSRVELAQNRTELANSVERLRDSISQTLTQLNESVVRQMQIAAVAGQQNSETLRQTVDTKLTQIQADLATRLELMRATVDEKLQATLDRRIGEAFKAVGDQLQAVQKGLGEMITVAESARDLKNLFMNIKSRGGLGELQLEAVLQNMLSPGQFQLQYSVSNNREKVDAVICLPGIDATTSVLLPIDAKFPIADAQRLFVAQESGDQDAIRAARSAFESLIRQEAKSIFEKYVRPPTTTDFAIMFLPSESLFAESTRSPDLLDDCHKRYKTILAGPTSLWAILNSLRIGFRTLAIQSRAGEIQERLDIVRREFGKFSQLLTKVSSQLSSAQETLGSVEKQNRKLEASLEVQPTLLAPQLAPSAASATDTSPPIGS